jgi:CheY-like chemotaxis protein
MGIPESNITYAFEGEQAIKEIESNMQQHLLDPQNQLFTLIITDYCVPHASGIDILKAAKTIF